ncbi:noncompact myelin-associated protein isoform X2 [Equus asinus]|uniref:noncompact myelin-associated protein isoform X2 n=1 Tax=Equus asinus TaxID=9793 RepID=UPI0038F72DF6
MVDLGLSAGSMALTEAGFVSQGSPGIEGKTDLSTNYNGFTWIEMTTATPLGGTTFFSLNVTTGGEDFLYKSSGAIVAAIVVVVIIIFTVVLILLKMYNRKISPELTTANPLLFAEEDWP